MQALVTGGSGFIGSETIRQLVDQGIKVRALLRKTSSRKNLKGVEFEEALGDLSDLESLKSAVQGVDFVFHLAGTVSAKTREIFFQHNQQGTANLARACAEVNPKLTRFIYVSSLAASGPSSSINPRLETDKEKPISSYGESKLGGELVLDKWAQSYPVTIIRPPAVYGPRDKAFLEFIKIINAGIMPVLKGSNETKGKYYSLIHVEDLVRGIVECGLGKNAKERKDREVYFLAGDGIHEWKDIMQSMAGALNKKVLKVSLPSFFWAGVAAWGSFIGKFTRITPPLTLDKLKELQPDYWICSNERVKNEIGFKPRYSLNDGLAHTISWYKENGWI